MAEANSTPTTTQTKTSGRVGEVVSGNSKALINLWRTRIEVKPTSDMVGDTPRSSSFNQSDTNLSPITTTTTTNNKNNTSDSECLEQLRDELSQVKSTLDSLRRQLDARAVDERRGDKWTSNVDDKLGTLDERVTTIEASLEMVCSIQERMCFLNDDTTPPPPPQVESTPNNTEYDNNNNESDTFEKTLSNDSIPN